MNKCRIHVLRKVCQADLMEKYELPMENACELKEGEVFIVNGLSKPPGLCESAWQSMFPFVMALACGGGGIYGRWMKDQRTALVSCNDGFRPVSFFIEALEEEADG